MSNARSDGYHSLSSFKKVSNECAVFCNDCLWFCSVVRNDGSMILCTRRFGSIILEIGLVMKYWTAQTAISLNLLLCFANDTISWDIILVFICLEHKAR